MNASMSPLLIYTLRSYNGTLTERLSYTTTQLKEQSTARVTTSYALMTLTLCRKKSLLQILSNLKFSEP